MATGDLDGDGRVDVVINNNNSGTTVLRNVTEPSGNWLAIRLEGTRSSRYGYGSEVIVTMKSGRRLRAYADSAGSYLSSSSPVLHFGLSQEHVAQLAVLWPSGLRTVKLGARTNTQIRIREPNH